MFPSWNFFKAYSSNYFHVHPPIHSPLPFFKKGAHIRLTWNLSFWNHIAKEDTSTWLFNNIIWSIKAEAKVVSAFTFWRLFSQNYSGSFLCPLSVLSSCSNPELGTKNFSPLELVYLKSVNNVQTLHCISLFIFINLCSLYERIKLDKYKIW